MLLKLALGYALENRGRRFRLQRRWAEEAGFSLIEMLLAAVIVGIAALGLALMFGLAQSLGADQRDTRVALQLAVMQIERARAQGFSAILAQSGGDCTKEIRVGVCEKPVAFPLSGPVTWKTEVRCVEATTLAVQDPCPKSPVALRVTVTVTPQPGLQRRGAGKSITLNSLLRLY